VEGRAQGAVWRLGRAGWAAERQDGAGTVLARNGEIVAQFEFVDGIRAGARAAVAALRQEVGMVEMLSGDTEAACRKVAVQAGIDSWRSGLLPTDKVARIEELTRAGRKVLMVGDGLNDAPALGA